MSRLSNFRITCNCKLEHLPGVVFQKSIHVFLPTQNINFFCVFATHEEVFRYHGIRLRYFDTSLPYSPLIPPCIKPPGHVLHSGSLQEVRQLLPAVLGSVDLAGPLGLLVVPPASTRVGDKVIRDEAVVGPSAGTRQHGMFQTEGWKMGNQMDHQH